MMNTDIQTKLLDLLNKVDKIEIRKIDKQYNVKVRFFTLQAQPHNLSYTEPSLDKILATIQKEIANKQAKERGCNQ